MPPEHRPFWLSAFLDFAPEHWPQGPEYWAAIAGAAVSASRGDDGEFATLVPADGDDHLRLQRLEQGPDRIHLDLHVADPRAVADRAVGLGAAEVLDHPQWGYVVLTSPAGITLCLVSHRADVVPPPMRWPEGHLSRIDQVCLDVPATSYDAERAFWAALTGWEPRASAVSEDFAALQRPDDIPMRMLFQRLADPATPAGVHLDLAATDRAAEVARHVALGARIDAIDTVWTVLVDPAGRRYCITDRDPVTGVLG